MGAIPLQGLTPIHLQDYKERALREGRVDGSGGLSPATVRYHLNILNGALEEAVSLGYVTRNVARSVKKSRITRAPVVTLAMQDIPRFLKAARDILYGRLFYTALWTGMRLGELLAVRWCDINFELGTSPWSSPSTSTVALAI